MDILESPHSLVNNIVAENDNSNNAIDLFSHIGQFEIEVGFNSQEYSASIVPPTQDKFVLSVGSRLSF